ncbi:hypothetical protein EJ419_05900 [Alloscardovia theropitheci]|uniref:Uncharacterized protein n=1 Tax=Alloscardovia theropitheci TaxID=2496842 RepID=A0A4R0QP16_9BIFI|nr:hypothetical protein [Alloscardovia theropitheci]TCD53962.1 hypothetical protein EJ419_05900 [Alloscardovia theropitheci]
MNNDQTPWEQPNNPQSNFEYNPSGDYATSPNQDIGPNGDQPAAQNQAPENIPLAPIPQHAQSSGTPYSVATTQMPSSMPSTSQTASGYTSPTSSTSYQQTSGSQDNSGYVSPNVPPYYNNGYQNNYQNGYQYQAQQKLPFYKQAWFWVITIIIAIALVFYVVYQANGFSPSSISDSNSSRTQSQKSRPRDDSSSDSDDDDSKDSDDKSSSSGTYTITLLAESTVDTKAEWNANFETKTTDSFTGRKAMEATVDDVYYASILLTANSTDDDAPQLSCSISINGTEVAHEEAHYTTLCYISSDVIKKYGIERDNSSDSKKNDSNDTSTEDSSDDDSESIAFMKVE